MDAEETFESVIGATVIIVDGTDSRRFITYEQHSVLNTARYTIDNDG